MIKVHRKCGSLTPFYSVRRPHCFLAICMTFEMKLNFDLDVETPKMFKLKYYKRNSHHKYERNYKLHECPIYFTWVNFVYRELLLL